MTTPRIPTIVCWLCHVAIPGYRTVQLPPKATYSGPPVDYFIGFSQGCTGLRDTIMKGTLPLRGVLTVDGTHSSWPMTPAHVNVWRELYTLAMDAAEPRNAHPLANQIMWHTMWLDGHRYTEHSGTGSYASTASVMRAALPVAPPENPSPVVWKHRAERFLAEAYPSKMMDKAAHESMGRMVREFALRMVSNYYIPRPADLHTVAEWMLHIAGEDLATGFEEMSGALDDPDILAMGALCRRGGWAARVVWDVNDPQGVGGAVVLWGGPAERVATVNDETAWCAVWASMLYTRALAIATVAHRMDVVMTPDPHKPALSPRLSVREICEDAAAAGRLKVANGDYVPQPGDLAIEARDGGNPLKGGTGHVRLITQWETGELDEYAGIGGNESNKLSAAMNYRKSEAVAFVSMQ